MNVEPKKDEQDPKTNKENAEEETKPAQPVQPPASAFDFMGGMQLGPGLSVASKEPPEE